MSSIASPAATGQGTLSAPSDAASQATPQRVMSVDVLRGLDMFFIVGMEEVFAAFSKIFPMSPTLNSRVQHAHWAGFHFYDLIFPLFAFIIGTSLVFSLSKSVAAEGRGAASIKVLKRTVILFILGLLYYGGMTEGYGHIRLLGVLQRLAICYGAAGLAFIWFGPLDSRRARGVAGLAAALLVSYWAMLVFIPVPGFGAGDFAEKHNLTNWLDKQYLPLHQWNGDHDPEGLLSTLPAIASSLLGVLAGLLLKNPSLAPARKVGILLTAGCAGIVAALLWHLEFPIIKKIWTSSFVLLTAGISSLLLGLLYYLVDLKNHRGWCRPFLWIGMNPITIYLIVRFVDLEAIAKCFVGGEIYSGLENLRHGFGDLAIAMLALGFAVLICRFLYQRKIFLRV